MVQLGYEVKALELQVQVSIAEAFELEVGGFAFAVPSTLVDGIYQRASMCVDRPVSIQGMKHVVDAPDVLLLIVVRLEAAVVLPLNRPGEDDAFANLELGVGFFCMPSVAVADNRRLP